MRPIPDVSGLDVVFCTRAMEILPPMADIPDEFKSDRCRWVKVVHDWFFFGLKDAKWSPKKGVNQKKALAAVAACMGDWEPQHEHKTAGCSFLLAEWFEDVTYKRAKEPGK